MEMVEAKLRLMKGGAPEKHTPYDKLSRKQQLRRTDEHKYKVYALLAEDVVDAFFDELDMVDAPNFDTLFGKGKGRQLGRFLGSKRAPSHYQFEQALDKIANKYRGDMGGSFTGPHGRELSFDFFTYRDAANFAKALSKMPSIASTEVHQVTNEFGGSKVVTKAPRHGLRSV
jgi:hypothetical protein